MSTTNKLDKRDVVTANGIVWQSTTTTGSEAAPTTSDTGLPLAGISELHVTVQSSNGTSALSNGWLRFYLYHPYLNAVVRAPTFDLEVAHDAGMGLTAQTFPARLGQIRYGDGFYVPDGLGTGVIVTIVGTLGKGLSL